MGADLQSRHPTFDVVLHAGPHKTGTTTFQSLIKNQRERLQHAGIFVPASGQDFTGSHESLAAVLAGRKEAGLVLQTLVEELSVHAPARILISAEETKRFIVDGDGATIVETLRRLGARSIQIVLYLRSPFALVNAIYAQWMVRRILGGQSFSEFVDWIAATNCFDYEHFLKLAKLEGVTLVVRPYRLAGVAQDLVRVLGLDWKIAIEGPLNRTFGPIAIEAIRQLCAEMQLEDQLREKTLTLVLFRICNALNERKFWGVDESVERALARADRKSDELAQAAWGKPWRDVVPAERNPLNIYDPQTAAPDQRALFEQVLGKMRIAALAAEAARANRAER